jgi:hypothetical protein
MNFCWVRVPHIDNNIPPCAVCLVLQSFFHADKPPAGPTTGSHSQGGTGGGGAAGGGGAGGGLGSHRSASQDWSSGDGAAAAAATADLKRKRELVRGAVRIGIWAWLGLGASSAAGLPGWLVVGRGGSHDAAQRALGPACVLWL